VRPFLLNDFFRIAQYNGGYDDEDDGTSSSVEHILDPNPLKETHLLTSRRNVDLVLQYTRPEGFSLSHFFVQGESTPFKKLAVKSGFRRKERQNVQQLIHPFPFPFPSLSL
jgi:hypothetical protein